MGYTLLWSPSLVSGFLNDSLRDGVVELCVIDSMQCQNFNSYDLEQPPPVYPIVTQNAGVLQTDSNYIDYQWFDPNGPITGETDFYYSCLNGMYWVEVIDSNACSGASLLMTFCLAPQ